MAAARLDAAVSIIGWCDGMMTTRNPYASSHTALLLVCERPAVAVRPGPLDRSLNRTLNCCSLCFTTINLK